MSSSFIRKKKTSAQISIKTNSKPFRNEPIYIYICLYKSLAIVFSILSNLFIKQNVKFWHHPKWIYHLRTLTNIDALNLDDFLNEN